MHTVYTVYSSNHWVPFVRELRLCEGLLDQITTDGLSFTDKIGTDNSGLVDQMCPYWSLMLQMKQAVVQNVGNEFYSLVNPTPEPVEEITISVGEEVLRDGNVFLSQRPVSNLGSHFDH